MDSCVSFLSRGIGEGDSRSHTKHLHGAEDMNSVSHICTAHPLPTEDWIQFLTFEWHTFYPLSYFSSP